MSIIDHFTHVHYPPTKWPRFEFEEDKCTHCKSCYLACPTSCIQWDEKKKIPYATGLVEMEIACLGCNNCEAVCPVGCIRLRGEYRVLKGRYKTLEERSGDMYPPCPFGKKDLSRSFEETEKELTETERIILRRRSIRLFRDTPVPKELIHRIIEAARYAPSAGNNIPWKFVVVTDKELNKRLERESSKILYMIKWLYAGRGLMRKIVISLVSYLRVNDMDQRPIAALQKVKQLNGSIIWNAPVVIYILADHRAIGDPNLDTGLAAENLILAAHSLGLGTCLIGLIPNALKYLPHLRKKLGIIYPYKCITSVCVGYPRGKLDNPVWRGKVPVDWIE
ncbi:MAG: nitroreductase family protein [Deltaproteobacteria bacterium]|nr:nitroreductase family protein [Deltaproteobacteria bacterium]